MQPRCMPWQVYIGRCAKKNSNIYIVNIIIFAIVNNITDITLGDCIWGEYGEWSTCSATCGVGTKTRTRPEAIPGSNGGDPCTGLATETGHCNPNSCPGRSILKDIPTRVLVLVKLQ